MSEVIFTFKGKITTIQCNIKDTMKDIFKDLHQK
jgi:hypothetical protein